MGNNIFFQIFQRIVTNSTLIVVITIGPKVFFSLYSWWCLQKRILAIIIVVSVVVAPSTQMKALKYCLNRQTDRDSIPDLHTKCCSRPKKRCFCNVMALLLLFLFLQILFFCLPMLELCFSFVFVPLKFNSRT